MARPDKHNGRRPSRPEAGGRSGFLSVLQRWLGVGAESGTSDALDLRHVVDDPIRGFYLSKGDSFLLSISVDRCRTFGLALDSGNPLVQTLIDYGAGRCKAADDSPLADYYRRWQPATTAEALGLFDQMVSPELLTSPSNGLVLPWSPGSATDDAMTRLKRSEFRKARRRLGLDRATVSGILYYGPVSDAFLKITFERLTRVYDSIRRDGFRERASTGYPRGRALIAGETCCIQLNSGKHRAAAVAALGLDRLPVQIGPGCAVRRSEVSAWPKVVSSTFTHAQALAVFDRHCSGTGPFTPPEPGSPVRQPA